MVEQGILKKRDPIKRVRLATLTQKQNLPIHVQIDENSYAHLEGGLDLLQWRDVKLLVEPIQTALVRAKLVQAELVTSECVVFQDSTGWYLSFLLDGDTTTGFVYDLPRISAFVEVVVAGMVQGPRSRSSGSLMMNSNDNVTIDQVVNETLMQNGGKRLVAAVKVLTHAHAIDVSGKLSPKLSQANFHPEKVSLRGRFCGFNLDKKELMFVVGKSSMTINFELELLDLLEITRACKDSRNCEIHAHRTVDRSGQYVFAYLPAAPFRR